jgi:hypothetical protein
MSVVNKNIFRKIIYGWIIWLSLMAVANSVLAQDTVTVEAPIEEVVDEHEDHQASLIADTPVMRHVPVPVVDSLKKLKVFEYANDPEYWAKEKEEEGRSAFWDFIGRLFGNEAFKWFIYILFGSLLLWALYKIIVSNNLFIFYSRNKKIKEELTEEEIQMEEATLDEKIAKLIAEKNYRPAVRYHYIKILQQLNEKGWIKYHPQATNYDYVKQMSQNKWGDEFRFLTQVYEYVWYGEFDITEEQFSFAHDRFNNFMNQSKS